MSFFFWFSVENYPPVLTNMKLDFFSGSQVLGGLLLFIFYFEIYHRKIWIFGLIKEFQNFFHELYECLFPSINLNFYSFHWHSSGLWHLYVFLLKLAFLNHNKFIHFICIQNSTICNWKAMRYAPLTTTAFFAIVNCLNENQKYCCW